MVLKGDESIKETSGAFIAITVPQEGEVIDGNEILLTIQGTDEDVKLSLPFACVIAEVNRDLIDALHVSGEDWILKVEKFQHD